MKFADAIKNNSNPTGTNSLTASKRRNQKSDKENENKSETNLQFHRKLLKTFDSYQSSEDE